MLLNWTVIIWSFAVSIGRIIINEILPTYDYVMWLITDVIELKRYLLTFERLFRKSLSQSEY